MKLQFMENFNYPETQFQLAKQNWLPKISVTSFGSIEVDHQKLASKK
jgi:hypothetical protein